MTQPASETDPIRIIAVDDHSLLRNALCELLNAEGDLTVVAQTDEPARIKELARRHDAEVLLLDVEMPDSHAPTVVAELSRALPDLKILILSMHGDPQLIQELLRRGAKSYLHKSTRHETLLAAIRNTRSADAHTIIAVPQQEGRQNAFAPAPAGLSPREREVLTLVAHAMSNRQIANRLGVAEGTVKRHLRNIFEKLEAVSRVDAVNKAIDAHLIVRRPHLADGR
ncbi:response regulator transcription factor [Streptomyces montanus]|uniref:Response regulator transcription factor n=1 Tax=Streptomyces montanus TaxID=2580423 RepID=A0A5R9G388_9ACTN|nr:response regulator transcription factor [Streptomyces montanus]TLS47353.1 response regulator transcription factor [Streptomyces montanus]